MPRELSFEIPFELPLELPWGIEPQQVALVLVGALLVLSGRRLYWLALGAVGFGVGLWLFENIRGGFYDPSIRLLVAVVLGIGGAVAAILLQKLAVSIIGFFGGLAAVFWLSEPWRTELGSNLWWLAILGAVLGTLFSSALFEAGLIVATSLLGSGLISSAIPLEPPHGTLLFLGLIVVGLMVQTRSGQKRKRRKVDRADD